MPAKTVSADEIIRRIEKGEKISYENVTVTGDFDLSRLPARTNDATYPENGKTARVYTSAVKSAVTFKNVVFEGGVDFFRKDENAAEIKEYRLAFADAVTFENCTFNGTTDFELTNFNGGVSFAGSFSKPSPPSSSSVSKKRRTLPKRFSKKARFSKIFKPIRRKI